jgi:hypothetical protein
LFCYVSEQAFLYKTVNGVLDNNAFLEKLNVNIWEGGLHAHRLFSYHIPKTVMYKNLPSLRIHSIYNSVTVKYPELDYLSCYYKCFGWKPDTEINL